MVARLLTAKEVADNPKAQKAILTEGSTLESQGTWDLSAVMEKWELVKDSRAKGDQSRSCLSDLLRKGQ
eukprot:11579655-Heterocapsa_arctica.AAC.1